MKRTLLLILCASIVCTLPAQTGSAKRGISFGSENPLSMADLDALSPAVSWFYTWGVGFPSAVSSYRNYGYDFYPMAFRANFDANAIRNFKTAHPECEYILAFNEPNLKDQANMTPAQAADAWPKLKSLAQELNMKLVSPAMNFGTLTNYGDPSKWLDEFFAQANVSIDDVDAIAIHSYMPWSLEWYIDNYFAKYQKPIWVTEYCAWDGFKDQTDGTPKAQMEALVRFVNLMETRSDIARYAWFLGRAKDGEASFPYHSLLSTTSGQLTDAGLIYANLSSYDDNYYFDAPSRMQAQHYISMQGAYFEKTGDESGIINAYTYKGSNNPTPELTYNVDVAATKEYSLNFRVATTAASKVDIYSNTKKLSTLNISNTNGNWTTVSLKQNLSAGRQKIRLLFSSGLPKINWWEIFDETMTDISTVRELTGVVECVLMDMQGRIIEKGKNEAAIRLDRYSSGMYILVSKLTNGETRVRKIVRRKN